MYHMHSFHCLFHVCPTIMHRRFLLSAPRIVHLLERLLSYCPILLSHFTEILFLTRALSKFHYWTCNFPVSVIVMQLQACNTTIFKHNVSMHHLCNNCWPPLFQQGNKVDAQNVFTRRTSVIYLYIIFYFILSSCKTVYATVVRHLLLFMHGLLTFSYR